MDGDISTRSSDACTAERENNCYRHMVKVAPESKHWFETNLQCATIGCCLGMWYNLFRILRTSVLLFGTPWSGHSEYSIWRSECTTSDCNVKNHSQEKFSIIQSFSKKLRQFQYYYVRTKRRKWAYRERQRQEGNNVRNIKKFKEENGVKFAS
jgi:tRNA G10  N-methylase Trm11